MRAGIVLVQDGQLALIERQRGTELYYVLPGGIVDAGESPEEAARRETAEELGLDVEIGSLVATVIVTRPSGSTRQLYYVAVVTGGTCGTGTGEEFADAGEPRGTYRPVWRRLEACLEADVRPRQLVAALVGQGVDHLVASPLLFTEWKES